MTVPEFLAAATLIVIAIIIIVIAISFISKLIWTMKNPFK